ncbi:hypothetical protein RFI_26505 [Reticulomyxa filosa]|uniref:Uncharacterized protein n=1 Tax=Reticulomyxa filosa TaxID=46433 RepID=X6MBS4_RETFI|nr:hypothetical protein RFI_26505 [Reticulomyxa filosa]|eukprot:ETO10872.1 hypothetical protein RFI_26505 [Reticulomyxa filosa]
MNEIIIILEYILLDKNIILTVNYNKTYENQNKRGGMYGEDTLLKEIHFGSGGIIKLKIEELLINYGLIQSNGGGGGGSGGSILIESQIYSNI